MLEVSTAKWSFDWIIASFTPLQHQNLVWFRDRGWVIYLYSCTCTAVKHALEKHAWECCSSNSTAVEKIYYQITAIMYNGLIRYSVLVLVSTEVQSILHVVLLKKEAFSPYIHIYSLYLRSGSAASLCHPAVTVSDYLSSCSATRWTTRQVRLHGKKGRMWPRTVSKFIKDRQRQMDSTFLHMMTRQHVQPSSTTAGPCETTNWDRPAWEWEPLGICFLVCWFVSLFLGQSGGLTKEDERPNWESIRETCFACDSLTQQSWKCPGPAVPATPLIFPYLATKSRWRCWDSLKSQNRGKKTSTFTDWSHWGKFLQLVSLCHFVCKLWID